MKQTVDPIGMTLELSRLIRKALVTQSKTQKTCNPIRMHALTFIEDAGEMTMTSFAQMMNISPSSASMLIDRMVVSKLVQRRHNSKNRKQVFIRLTVNGKRLLKRHLLEKKRVLAEIFKVLTPADRRTLHRILANVLTHAH